MPFHSLLQIEVKERAERESSIFFENEKKIYSTQIEGNDSNREGINIGERTTTFIAGPYSPYDTVFEAADMIFEANFYARFSRFFWAQISRSI